MRGINAFESFPKRLSCICAFWTLPHLYEGTMPLEDVLRRASGKPWLVLLPSVHDSRRERDDKRVALSSVLKVISRSNR
jgi:hypothetical protein